MLASHQHRHQCPNSNLAQEFSGRYALSQLANGSGMPHMLAVGRGMFTHRGLPPSGPNTRDPLNLWLQAGQCQFSRGKFYVAAMVMSLCFPNWLQTGRGLLGLLVLALWKGVCRRGHAAQRLPEGWGYRAKLTSITRRPAHVLERLQHEHRGRGGFVPAWLPLEVHRGASGLETLMHKTQMEKRAVGPGKGRPCPVLAVLPWQEEQPG